MTATQWLQAGQLLIQAAGFIAVVVTVRINTAVLRQSVIAQRQKTDADNRTQWWTRYIWAEELRLSNDRQQRLLGWSHLNILSVSTLATSTEKDVILMLALSAADEDNGETPRDEDAQ